MLSIDQKAMDRLRVEILDLKSAINSVIDRDFAIPAFDPKSLSEGMIGQLGDYEAEVLQITDPTAGEFLGYLSPRRTGSRRRSSTSSGSKLVSISGLSVRNTVDRDVVSFSRTLVFLVGGTHTYKTVSGGTNTVFDLWCISDAKEWAKSLESLRSTGFDEPELSLAEQAKVEAEKRKLAEIERKRRDDEQQRHRNAQAEAKLKAAKQFVTQGKKEAATKWLKMVSDEFPGTPAATEAQETLRQLEGSK